MISISNEDAVDLAEKIRSFMDHYSYNRQGADYTCLFCHAERDSTPTAEIVHKDDCDGERFLNMLKPNDGVK